MTDAPRLLNIMQPPGAGMSVLPVNQHKKPVDDPTIVFATPSYMHNYSAPYKRSIIQAEWLCAMHGYSTGHMERNGDCFIAKARSKLVTEFLHKFPTTQHFMFWDDDVGTEMPQKIIEFIHNPYPIVCGVYPKKSSEVDFPVSLVSEKGQLKRNEFGHYLANLAPTGFMRIRREVLIKLAEECNTFLDQEADGQVKEYFNIFESGRAEDKRFWGEDYIFCQKALACGFNVWVDPYIDFEHVGHHTWTDNLSRHIVEFENRAWNNYENSLAQGEMVQFPSEEDMKAARFREDMEAAE